MDALLKPALPTCIRYSLLKTRRRRPSRRRARCRSSRSSRQARRRSAVRYRAPVAYKVGKQTVVVASDFVFLRKGRTEIYLNVTGPSNDPASRRCSALARKLLARVRS